MHNPRDGHIQLLVCSLKIYFSYSVYDIKCIFWNNTEPPGLPVINMVMALNNFSASLSWTPSPYNCSLSYILEVVIEVNASVVFLDSTELTTMNVTTLNKEKTYSFMVTSVDEAARKSKWSQPVSLAMQGLYFVWSHKIVNE